MSTRKSEEAGSKAEAQQLGGERGGAMEEDVTSGPLHILLSKKGTQAENGEGVGKDRMQDTATIKAEVASTVMSAAAI